MNELDKMFDASGETALPPLVRYCKSRKMAGDRIEVELYRPDAAGESSRTVLVIHRWEKEEEKEPQQVEWDNGVNAGLVDLGIRAIDLQQEGERFALAIRAALRKVERRYGDGYLNAVLIDLLDESDLCKDGEIADVRKFVQTNPPERSRSYHDCRDVIANEIAGRAVELRDKLKYKPEVIKEVMTKALATYIDERFSVSSRRNFGLLSALSVKAQLARCQSLGLAATLLRRDRRTKHVKPSQSQYLLGGDLPCPRAKYVGVPRDSL